MDIGLNSFYKFAAIATFLMNFKPPIFLLFLAFVLFAGCSKWEEEPAISRLLIVNAFPDAASLNIRVNTSAESILNFGSATYYQQLRSGKSALQLGVGAIPSDTLDLFLAENRNYSLYLVRDIKADSSYQDSSFIQLDDLPAPEVGRAKIRFANLSPATEDIGLSLVLNGPTADTLAATAFTNFTAFTPIISSREYSLSLLRDSILIAEATIPAQALESERTYTIMATGYSTPPAGNPRGLTLRVIENREQ